MARETARMEEERATWRKAMVQTDTIAKTLRVLADPGSTHSQLVKELNALQSPVMSIAQQYQDLFRPGSAVGDAFKAWQESERAQSEHMRKLLDPMDDIRNRLLGDSMTQQLIKELTEGNSKRDYMKEIAGEIFGIGSVAQILCQQAEESRAQTKKLFEKLSVGTSIQRYLKDFEHINKQWTVPSEVLGIVGSFKEIQEQLGLAKVALPTIDWGSAAALAKVLGPEGIQEQLALLGIRRDGSMQSPLETPEKGILSRRQSDAVALLSLLLSILFFLHQEFSSLQDKARTEAIQTQNTATLQVQAQQIQNLTVLIGQALVQSAQEPDERFVVRGRPATVRSKPEHGAAVESKLLPNEVVRAIDKDGKWVGVEYYHWLHEKYKTGWVLKKYLERVPASHSKS